MYGKRGPVSNARLGQYSFCFVEFLRLIEVIWIRTCMHLWVLLFMPDPNA